MPVKKTSTKETKKTISAQTQTSAKKTVKTKKPQVLASTPIVAEPMVEHMETHESETREMMRDSIEVKDPSFESEAPPVLPSSSYSYSPQKKSFLSGVVILGIVVFLALSAVAVQAAKQLGTQGSLSFIAQYIPLEKIPVIKNFVKSPQMIITDAVVNNFGLGKLEKYGSIEDSTKISFNVKGTQGYTQSPVVADLHLDFYSYTNKDLQQKLVSTVSGKIQSGAFNMDLGNPGATMHMIVPDAKNYYFSLELSPELQQTAEGMFMGMMASMNRPLGSGVREPLPSDIVESQPRLGDYLGKYFRFDMEEYANFLNEVQEFSQSINPSSLASENVSSGQAYQDMRQAAKELITALEPDLKQAYRETFGNMSMYSNIRVLPREQVNGKLALVYAVDIQNDKVGEVLAQFVRKLPSILKNHRSDLLAYCKKMYSFNSRSCNESTIDRMIEVLEEDVTQSEKFDKNFDDLFEKYVTVKDVKVYVHPTDSSLLKLETKFDIHQDDVTKAQNKARGAQASEIESFIISVSSEELSRGQQIPVEAPAESIDAVELMRSYAKKKQAEVLEMMGKNNKRSLPTPQR